MPDTPENSPVRWYFYTSGTTSDPKGAQHTDVSVIHGGVVNADCIGMTADDTEVLIFPFTHIGGANIMCSALLTGARLALVEAFRDPNAVADFIKQEKVTIVPGATPIHQAFVGVGTTRAEENLFESVRIFPSGGAPIPPALHYQVKELIGRGNSTREIAEQLHLSVKTIETYRAHIKDKLQLRSGTELMQRAIHWVENDSHR